MNDEKVTDELLNLGYVQPVLKSTDFKLGVISRMPNVIVNETGDWSLSYPNFESQLRPKFDSHGCTCYACNNAREMYLKHVFGYDFDCSERYHYNILHIRPPGADPLNVLQNMREDGALRESRLPITDTFAQFCTPDPMTIELLKEGRRFRYKLWYETLWLGKISKAKRMAIIKDNARKGTIVFSVTAYFKQGDVYVDNGQANSHLVAYGAMRENGFEIFDSYEDDGKPIKIISYDHDIRFAARIVMTPIEEVEQINWAWSLLNSLIVSFKNLILPSKTTYTPPTPAPVIPPVVPVERVTPPPVLLPVKEDLLTKFCLAIRKHEGWYEGSRSWRNNNPGNLRFVGQKRATGKDAQNFCIFKTYEDGMLTLREMIVRVGDGRSLSYPKDCTLLQFFRIYAPREDNNDPDAYTRAVAKYVGVDINYQLINLIKQ